MRFDDYQSLAIKTSRLDSQDQDPVMVALFGLAGEMGSLHTLYKKRSRDGDQLSGFREKVKEEIGDVLWYLSALACLEGFTLSEIASENLEKTQSRWLPTGDDDRVHFDEHFPESERLPRSFIAEFVVDIEDGVSNVKVLVDGVQCGSTLSDNAYTDDGYRFHDIFHMTSAAILGWSPVVRSLLKRKRKSDKQIDEVEDGGRAIATDEALAAVVFTYAFKRKYLEEVKVLDWQLLDLCSDLTRPFEVAKRSRFEWEQTILKTFEIWRNVQQNNGGWVRFDSTNRTAEFFSESPAGKAPLLQ